MRACGWAVCVSCVCGCVRARAWLGWAHKGTDSLLDGVSAASPFGFERQKGSARRHEPRSERCQLSPGLAAASAWRGSTRRCLCKLLDGIQDHYTYAQPGIQRTVFHTQELVRWVAACVARCTAHGRGTKVVVCWAGRCGRGRHRQRPWQQAGSRHCGIAVTPWVSTRRRWRGVLQAEWRASKACPLRRSLLLCLVMPATRADQQLPLCLPGRRVEEPVAAHLEKEGLQVGGAARCWRPPRHAPDEGRPSLHDRACLHGL